jgi:glycosyltransferase involved in cell wall biosynthesis
MNSNTQIVNRIESGVSVIIPLYNKRDTVARAISSILRQEGVDKEIIVVDVGSTDDSAEHAKAFGDRIVYVWQKNQGPSAARNHGARLSKFNKLVFLDADDELMEGCLAAHVACRKVVPEIEVSLASFQVMKGNSISRQEILTERLGDVSIEHGFSCLDHFLSKMVVNIASGCICVNKDIFERAGLFDEELRCWEITDLMYRLALPCHKMGILQGLFVTIHEDKNSSSFEKLGLNATYRRRFADKLLDRVSEVPENQRNAIFEKITSVLDHLASTRDAQAFKRIAQRACHHRMFAERRQGLCHFSGRSVSAIKFFLYFWRWKYRRMLHPDGHGDLAKKCAE